MKIVENKITASWLILLAARVLKNSRNVFVFLFLGVSSPTWAATVNGVVYDEIPKVSGSGDVYYDDLISGFTEDLIGSGVTSTDLGGVSLSFQYLFDGSPGIFSIFYQNLNLQDSMTIVHDVFNNDSFSLALDFSGTDAEDLSGYFAKGALVTFYLPLMGTDPLAFFNANSQTDAFGTFYAAQDVNFSISAAVETVPLPSSSILFLSALGGMIYLRRAVKSSSYHI